MGSKEKPVQDEKKYLQQLLILGQTLNSSLNLETVLNTAIDSVVDFIRAERGFIMMLGENEKLELKAFKNVEKESIEKMEGISKTILLQVARDGNNIISVDAQKDQRFRDVDSVMLTGMRSVLCVPLKVQEKTIGIIYLDNRIEEGMFNDLHLDMLAAFANQAAVAIENARLHENLIKSYVEKIKLTEDLHAQEKIRLASEEANKMKSEFVNIVSHELRSPLTVIKTYTSTLNLDSITGRFAIDENTKQDIYQTIDREVDRLLNMINKLLDVSRIDDGKPMMMDFRKGDIVSIVDDVIKMQSTSKFFRSKKHSIKREIQENLPGLVCDREKMTQVLLNLVENALKYSPDGGEVTVKIGTDEKNMNFIISDQGMGIPEKDLEKLFRKFERMEQSRRTIPGTGLGLYLVKHLIELQHGTVNVKSTPGKGSSFEFSIPLNLEEKGLTV